MTSDITPRMPALFVAHGSPMNAILDTPWSRAWQALGQQLPRPRAILAISAHFQTHGVVVTAMPQPRTIHDFGGFPRELFEVQYPAPGSPELAQRVAELLAPDTVLADAGHWGLDHGSWSVLVHMYPNADIPVVQLSLDADRSPAQQYHLAQRLLPLRDEGVMIIGFGNVVHNLHAARRDATEVPPYPWAASFDAAVRDALLRGDHAALCQWQQLAPQAEYSNPTDEHYLPLLYAAAVHDGEAATFPTEGIVWGSISMRSVAFGATQATIDAARSAATAAS